MKMRLTIFALLTASVAIFSCSKDKNTPKPEENESGGLMTKMIQGLVPGQDTVFVFNYDANNRIKSVINVSDLDTFEASFNTTGLVMTIIAKGPGYRGTRTFTFNANNQLLQAEFLPPAGNFNTKYTFEYTNGVVSRKNYYYASGGSELKLFSYTTYEVTNGNITSTKEFFVEGNTFVREVKFTYNNEPNIFQQICLFNWIDFLGADDMAGMEMFFNKNLVTGSTRLDPGFEPANSTYTYTYNDKKQLTKLVVIAADVNIATRQFEY